MSADGDNAEIEPGFVPRTPLQERILEESRKQPTPTPEEIADTVGCSKSYVHEVLAGGWKHYCRKERREQLSETQRAILVGRELFPDATPEELAYLAGCAPAYVYRTLGSNGHLIGETDPS